MNGSDTPVLGIVLVTTAILRITCMAICANTPVASIEPNKSGAFCAIWLILHNITINRAIRQNAPKSPNSSHITENIISFCDSVIYPSF